MPAQWVDQLSDYWKSKGLRHTDLATQQEIDDFEQRYNVVIPDDLRDYFSGSTARREVEIQ